jgi:hypothetical protein
LQFGKGVAAPGAIANLRTLRVDLRGVGHAVADSINGNQAEALVKTLRACVSQGAEHTLQEFLEDDKGQSLPPFTQIAFAHGHPEQPKQVFA